MPVTQFTSADLLPALEALAPPETFLNRTFFPGTSYFVGRFAQVDSRKARRWLAPIVKRGQIGRVVAREPYKTSFFEVPEIKAVRETSVSDLDDRLAGETAYSRRSGAERLAEIVARDLTELVDATTRRIEQMTASLLFTGGFSYLLDDNSVETLSYGSVTPVVPSVLWDATTGSDPCKDLASAASAITTASGLVADTVVMGSDALAAFLNNTTVQNQLDKLHLIVGGIQPSAPEGIGSAQFIGRLFRPYVSVYGYSEAFEDEATNALKPMIAPKDVLIGCSKSPALTSYGSVTQVEQNGETASYSDLKFVPRKLATPKEDRVELRIVSRPCLTPYDLESWKVIRPLPVVFTARAESSEREERKERRDK